MIFKMHLHLDNDAFQVGTELARIVKNLSDTLTDVTIEPCCYQNLLDANGNIVGKWAIKEEEL